MTVLITWPLIELHDDKECGHDHLQSYTLAHLLSVSHDIFKVKTLQKHTEETTCILILRKIASVLIYVYQISPPTHNYKYIIPVT